VAVTVCKACKQGWQNGAGREVPISAVDVEVALCDAQCLSLDGDAAKLTDTIPAAKRRFVWRRDHGRCTVAGCRAASFIDVHHIVQRAHGGSNEVTNLTLLCSGHHRALHDGLIVIDGPAPDFTVTRLSEVPHVGEPQRAPESAEPSVADEVELALITLGFLRGESRRAIDRARARVGEADLETLLRAALRECPLSGG
jgi:hypothetical protein